MMKKVKQKTTQQLHDEIMQLFIGQEMSTTLFALVETYVNVANFMEITPFHTVDLVMNELKNYMEIKDGSKN